jgi:glycerol-3-phosphate dehydrogenase
LIPSVGENRFLFVIPWQGRTVIGTTDTDYEGSLDDPRAGNEEVDRVVQSAARAFPEARLSTADVISTFAGLRPLIDSGAQSTKELSRKEEIFEDNRGLITITGGKLTTWRRMAERVVDFIARRIELTNGARRPQIRDSVTEHLELAGGRAGDNPHYESRHAATEYGLEISTVEHLMATYGGNYLELLKLTVGSEDMKRILIDGLQHIEAEVAYAAQYEMALTVEDFLSRRTRIDLLATDHGRSCAARVAQLLGSELI